jgi:hypothetical protein
MECYTYIFINFRVLVKLPIHFAKVAQHKSRISIENLKIPDTKTTTP